MDQDQKKAAFAKGRKVTVTHLQGSEVGEIESVNWNSGKVLVYFNYESCPHLDSFSIDQVELFLEERIHTL
jgi:hypothetical protein